MSYDDSGTFDRWVFQAAHDILCHTGPKDKDGDAEEVHVKKGEYFTTSNYAQFRLADHVGLEVMLFVKGDKRKLANGNDMWDMGMKVSPAVKAILEKRRLEKAALNSGRAAGAPAGQINQSAQAWSSLRDTDTRILKRRTPRTLGKGPRRSCVYCQPGSDGTGVQDDLKIQSIPRIAHRVKGTGMGTREVTQTLNLCRHRLGIW